MPTRRVPMLALTLVVGACSASRPASSTTDVAVLVPSEPAAPAAPKDPRKEEVALPAEGGWAANLVLDQAPTGIWTCVVDKVFPHYGCPEIVGIDDLGRCHVLWSYSGKWTPVTTIADGKWLGGIAIADVDPRIEGRELYTGSAQGNLYQVVAHPNTLLEHRMIGRIPGFEIHTVVATDLDPSRAGLELLVFTSPGRLYLARPRADGRDGFDLELVQELPGRVRDAIVLPAHSGRGTEVATVGRHGRLEILSWREGRPHFETIFEVPMGMGRIARMPSSDGRLVLYTTTDDGMVRRHEASEAGTWTHEIVYVGPQGPRGVCAGRFHVDPNVESIAVFGYAQDVTLLTRRDGVWTAETIFRDRDKGHWITVGEVDGRNATDEIVCTGYGGRIVLLRRPPGFGLGGAAKGAAVSAPSRP